MSSLTTKMDQIKTKIFGLKITDQYRDRERESTTFKTESITFLENRELTVYSK